MNLFGNNPSGCIQSKSSKLLEKIRACIPYFNRRLEMIERQGNAKILSDEIDMIESWLDIAMDVNPDTTMDCETLDVTVDSIIEMMRLHPIPEAFSTHPAKKDLEENEKVETVSSPNKKRTRKEGGLNFGEQIPLTPDERGSGYVFPTNQDFSSLTPVDPMVHSGRILAETRDLNDGLSLKVSRVIFILYFLGIGISIMGLSIETAFAVLFQSWSFVKNPGIVW